MPAGEDNAIAKEGETTVDNSYFAVSFLDLPNYTAPAELNQGSVSSTSSSSLPTQGAAKLMSIPESDEHSPDMQHVIPDHIALGILNSFITRRARAGASYTVRPEEMINMRNYFYDNDRRKAFKLLKTMLQTVQSGNAWPGNSFYEKQVDLLVIESHRHCSAPRSG